MNTISKIVLKYIGASRHLLMLMLMTLPVLSFAADLNLKVGDEHTFSMKGVVLPGTITYYWEFDDISFHSEEPTITYSWDEEGEYVVKASYEVNGCMSPVSQITVEVVSKELPDIIPDKFFTPNDDGVNDFWHIKNIEYYPDSQIEIYDRYNKLLLKTIGEQFIQNNGWDGIYNGHQVPSDDYWYYIRNILPNKPKSGHFILKR